LTSDTPSDGRGADTDELFRLLVANVSDYAIFMLDATGHIATWNVGAQRIKGYLADEIIGQHFSVFYPAHDVQAGKCEHELEVAVRVGRFEDEDWRLRKDGTRFWANVVITAVRDEAGALVGYAKITRDLTERKRSEDERLARLAAEHANRTKDDFLATLGHELRNPLAPIVTALQLTKLHPDRHPTRELQVIERQVLHLVHLVDDLLDVSRIARGKLELQAQIIDIRDPIASAIESVSPLLEHKAHRFELDVPPHALLVNGDAPRLTQVFANLIGNAAKYTDPGGHIAVHVAERDDQLVIEVRDDGIGIADDLRARMFEPFVQAEQASDRSRGGLGLGLGLVRALVELHGGTVEGHSPGAGQGSTFTVQLPAIARSAPSRELDSALSAAFRSTGKRCILVVDDNDDARMLLADILGELGHDVRGAADGVQALEAIRAFPVELAILDIGLPGMDGYELAAQLQTALPGIRLIAVSGYGQPADRARSHAVGFDRHLVKPIEVRGLLDAMTEVLGERARPA